MKTTRHILQDAGFTLIELMVATAVFSTILLLATAGLIDIGNTYYKGYISSQTQQTARTILNDIAQTIEYGGTINLTAADNPTTLCVGGIRYSFTYDKQLGTSTDPDYAPHVVLRDTPTGCNGAVNSPNTELIGANMRLAKLQIHQIGGSNVYTVTVRIIYGAEDLLNDSGVPGDPNNHQNCLNRTGQQFCQVSELTTSVQQRIAQ